MKTNRRNKRKSLGGGPSDFKRSEMRRRGGAHFSSRRAAQEGRGDRMNMTRTLASSRFRSLLEVAVSASQPTSNSAAKGQRYTVGGERQMPEVRRG